MKAIVQYRYGSSDVLELQEVAKPVVKDGEVLIRVRAASVNPYDWHHMTGTPYFMRAVGAGLLKPKEPIRGVDMAGVVEAVGADVTHFKPGDEVYGNRNGAFAEYISVGEARIAHKPANLTFEQAAAVPVAGLTALQGLRDRGQLRAGQKVLINGASGGVGTFAVQIAKAFGAEVTAVCSTRNVAAVKSLGADHVIDYKRQDFVQSGQRYDLIFDNAGNRSVADRKRVLKPDGTLVLISGPKKNRLFGPLTAMIKMLLAARFSSQRMVGIFTQSSQADLDSLRDLIETGKVTPVIERTYRFHEVPDAMRYVGEGHAQGKIVITV